VQARTRGERSPEKLGAEEGGAFTSSPLPPAAKAGQEKESATKTLPESTSSSLPQPARRGPTARLTPNKCQALYLKRGGHQRAPNLRPKELKRPPANPRPQIWPTQDLRNTPGKKPTYKEESQNLDYQRRRLSSTVLDRQRRRERLRIGPASCRRAAFSVAKRERGEREGGARQLRDFPVPSICRWFLTQLSYPYSNFSFSLCSFGSCLLASLLCDQTNDNLVSSSHLSERGTCRETASQCARDEIQ
jgi:hypothetical protein